MREMTITLFLAVALFIVGCGSGSVSKVKNGTLPLDDSITIGKAFDSYKFHDKPRWSTEETERGQELVVFTADIPPSLYKREPPRSEEDFEFLFRVVFIMNADRSSFSIRHVALGQGSLKTDGLVELEPVMAILANKPSATIDMLFDKSGCRLK